MNSPSQDEWEQLLDIDDSDLRLSATSQNPNVPNVTKIHGPAGIVQTAMIRKDSDVLEGSDVAMTQEYIRKVVDEGDDSDFKSVPWVNATEFINGNGCMMVGVFADIEKFLNKGKKSTQNDDNMDVDHDSKISSQNNDNMDVDQASKKSAKNDDTMDVEHDSKEDVFSPAHDLSTQEVQDVVDNLVGSPEYPIACEDERLDEAGERLDEAEEDVYGNEVANAG
ncbi:hypothetical protein CTI12_AA614770 [Artemisia annua]|uniref:Uncharacterized protein n=1 Tax=Artemisia annua TaxID=35608 RepID=A0A2U1KDT7_ARTAN|nr:hypothetical protein CTI12_AA614770 [Artemisia annua]